VDFAVDVPEVNVDWCRAAFRVSHKKDASEIASPAKVKYYEETNAWRKEHEVQTLYYGNWTGDCVRVYDKLAEAFYRIGKKQMMDDLYPFDHFKAGVEQLTRIEKTYRKRVPKELKTLDDLFANAATFKPFDTLTVDPLLAEW